MEEGLGNAAEACRALRLARSNYYLSPSQRPSKEQLQRKMVGLSEQCQRYGYRHLCNPRRLLTTCENAEARAAIPASQPSTANTLRSRLGIHHRVRNYLFGTRSRN